jgi:hypothetical protein
MKRLALLAAAGASLLASLSVDAEVPEETRKEIVSKYQKAFVRVERGPNGTGWGTGVVVQEQPPIVATCYHVINGAPGLTVYSPLKNIRVGVKRWWADGASDLAFLELATENWTGSVPIDALPANNRLSDADYLGFGFSLYNNRSTFDLRSNASAMLKLPDLGGAEPLDVLNKALQVFDFTAKSGFLSGDSGGPIFTGEGKLVALAAGTVSVKNMPRRHFAIPITAIPPQGFNPLSSSQPPHLAGIYAEGPYGRALGFTLTVHVRAASPLPPAPPGKEKCFDAINLLIVEHAGRRTSMPTTLDDRVAGVDAECQARYGTLKPKLIEHEAAYLSALTLRFFAQSAAEVEGFADKRMDSLKHTAKSPEFKNERVDHSLDALLAELREPEAKGIGTSPTLHGSGFAERGWGSLQERELTDVAVKLSQSGELWDDGLKELWSEPPIKLPPASAKPDKPSGDQRAKSAQDSRAKAAVIVGGVSLKPKDVATSRLRGVTTSKQLARAADLQEEAASLLGAVIGDLAVASIQTAAKAPSP